MTWRQNGSQMGKLAILAVLLVAGGVLLGMAGCGFKAQFSPKAVEVIQPAGEFALNSPNGLAVGKNGEVLVADTWHNRIVMLGGKDKAKVIGGSTSAEAKLGFADQVKFQRAGTEASVTGGTGPSTSLKMTDVSEVKFSYPYGVALDGAGNIYVSDTWNHRIQKLSPEGEPLAKWGEYGAEANNFSYPWGIAVDKLGNIFVADSANSRIIKDSQKGRQLLVIGKEGKQEGQFHLPLAVALDGQGNIYVTDTGNNRIEKLDAMGKYLLGWGKRGDQPGEFNKPTGIAVDSKDRVYVVDSLNHRVQVFDAAGKLLAVFGKRGKTQGEFEQPIAVAIGPNDKIYVLDWGNNRIQVFQP